MIESRSLRLFIALAEERHFSRAANRLNIAQSVLSVQVKRLEDTIGTPLLNRNKRAAVSLTRAGETFLAEAKAAIAQLDQAERIGRLAGRGEAGPLRIGYVFSAAICGLIPKILKSLHEHLPLLQITPVLMETPEQLRAIADGRIDFGFLRPRPRYPKQVTTRIVHNEGLLIALAAHHPLAASGQIHAADLAGETFIVPQFHENVGLIDKIVQLAEFGGFVLGDILRTSDFVTALSMAAGGYGIVLAPYSLARLRLEGVVFREILHYSDSMDLAIAFRSDAPAPLIASVMSILIDA